MVIRRFVLGCLAWAICLLGGGGTAVAGELEAKVKAAYLFHLMKFVDWPNLPPGDVRLCVQGSEEVAALVGDLANRTVRDRRLRVEAEGGFDPAQCQLLFIGRDERRTPDILRRLRGGAVLTVGDADDFARRGGMVGFYQEGGKIRLEINPDTARNAGLRLSAKLMEVARTVPGSGD